MGRQFVPSSYTPGALKPLGEDQNKKPYRRWPEIKTIMIYFGSGQIDGKQGKNWEKCAPYCVCPGHAKPLLLGDLLFHQNRAARRRVYFVICSSQRKYLQTFQVSPEFSSISEILLGSLEGVAAVNGGWRRVEWRAGYILHC